MAGTNTRSDVRLSVFGDYAGRAKFVRYLRVVVAQSLHFLNKRLKYGIGKRSGYRQ
jgi:hypothetical protein